MRKLLLIGLLGLGVGYVLASFLAAFYSHWYFSKLYWIKVALLAPPIAAMYLCVLLITRRRAIWLASGLWWIVCYGLTAWQQWNLDLRSMSFTSVLDYETALIWLPASLMWLVYGVAVIRAERQKRRRQRRLDRELALRRKARGRMLRLRQRSSPPLAPSA